MCVVVGLAATILFAAWQLLTPAGFHSVIGLNPRAVWEWRARAGLGTATVPIDPFATVFRALTVLGWAAYAGLVWAFFHGARLGTRWTWPLAIPVVVLLAVAMPPSLSTDVFAYVGYARLAVVHGMNPHLHTQLDLVRLGDPTSAYLRWPIASPYGPLWTLISMVVVLAAPAGSVLGAVVAFKLIAGVALVACAFASRALVRTVDPARADATFVMVAMNPLLLVEGPGSGHNDLVMVALLMAAFVLLARMRPRAAALVLGTAAAIKLVPLIVVPWLAIASMRTALAGWRARLGAGAVIVALALLPVVASYAPFWSGTRTLSGLVSRLRDSGSTGAESADGAGVPGARSANGASFVDDVSPGGDAGSGAAAASAPRTGGGSTRKLLVRAWPALLAYAWALLVMWLGRGNLALRMTSAWSIVALAVFLFVAGIWFPWYLAWLWPPIVTRLSRVHLTLGLIVFVLSLLLSMVYSMVPG